MAFTPFNGSVNFDASISFDGANTHAKFGAGRRRLIAQGIAYAEMNRSVLEEQQRLIAREQFRRIMQREREYKVLLDHERKMVAQATWSVVMAEC